MPSCGARISTRQRPTSLPAISMRWPGCWPALSRRPPSRPPLSRGSRCSCRAEAGSAHAASTFPRSPWSSTPRRASRFADSRIANGRREADHRDMPYETIEVRKVTPAIGAEISGVDLAGPLSNRQVSELHDALMAHQVIFFRDQQMSVEQHKAFGRLFGELLIHPAARAEVEDHPEIRVVHADEKTKVATGEAWPSDMSGKPEPPMGSILFLH